MVLPIFLFERWTSWEGRYSYSSGGASKKFCRFSFIYDSSIGSSYSSVKGLGDFVAFFVTFFCFLKVDTDE